MKNVRINEESTQIRLLVTSIFVAKQGIISFENKNAYKNEKMSNGNLSGDEDHIY